MNTRFLKAAIVLTSIILSANSANAEGWIAENIIKPFSPDLAEAADRWNHENGNPVDHAIAGFAETIVPGAGTVMELNWQINRTRQQASRLSVPRQSGNFEPRRRHTRTFGHPPTRNFGQLPLGNFCSTPHGRFGPGPLNPVGMPCTATTPWGVMFGNVSL